MATINNILSGSAGVKKRYQVQETMANIGAVVLVSPTGTGGLALASTGGAADMGGLNLTTATAVGPIGSDVVISNVGNITLGTVTAQGDDVVLTASSGASAITDGNGVAVNVTAKLIEDV